MTYENLDERLVNALLEDGRTSLRAIAETVDASVTTVSTHMRDLESEGRIRGFVPLIDYGTFGYDVTAISHLKVDGTALPAMTDSLASQTQLTSVFEVTGDHDVVIIGRYRDTADMNQHIKRILSDPDIKASNTSVVLNAVRDHEQFPLPID